MALSTSKALRNQVMYQIFVRNFSEEGTFRAVIPQLDRIKSLGTDVIWLMPIHPIGKAQRKGSLGSPYAISDYRAVNPEFGTLEDFITLVDEIHARGMKCIIDVVYNHTSPDSVLSKKHPEWFYHREDGSFGNRVGDWSDIIDLDYGNKALWDYQIETLRYWAQWVDGFRCDVAPLIPVEFWMKAREEVSSVKDCLWLSESVEPGFITYMRGRGLTALSDSEIFRAFDISYEYDCYGDFAAFLRGNGTLGDYVNAVNRQEYIYPDNYIKLRFLENHDQPRARHLIPNLKTLESLTAFMFFQKGMALIYAGQERAVRHLPSLFDRDTVDWSSPESCDLSELISRLSEIKRDPLFSDSVYELKAQGESFLVASHEKNGKRAVGVFPVKSDASSVNVPLEDGVYTNLLGGEPVEVLRGCVGCNGGPLIIRNY